MSSWEAVPPMSSRRQDSSGSVAVGSVAPTDEIPEGERREPKTKLLPLSKEE